MSQSTRFATYMVCAMALGLFFVSALTVTTVVAIAFFAGVQLSNWHIYVAAAGPFEAWVAAYAFNRLLEWSTAP